MRLLRNVYGEPPPLILHPRLRLLRLAHIRARFAVQRVLGRARTTPAYMRPEMAEDYEMAGHQDDRLLRACENFMGARGGNADQREAYRARAIEDLIADPTVPEDRKERLRDALGDLNPKPLAAVDAPTGASSPDPVAVSGGPETVSEEAAVTPPDQTSPTGARPAVTG